MHIFVYLAGKNTHISAYLGKINAHSEGRLISASPSNDLRGYIFMWPRIFSRTFTFGDTMTFSNTVTFFLLDYLSPHTGAAHARHSFDFQNFRANPHRKIRSRTFHVADFRTQRYRAKPVSLSSTRNGRHFNGDFRNNFQNLRDFRRKKLRKNFATGKTRKPPKRKILRNFDDKR